MNCTNDVPTAVNDSTSTNRNTNVTLTVLSNDTDLDHPNSALTVTGLTTGALGTPSIVGTGVLFVPSAGLCGTGTFTYRAEDGSG